MITLLNSININALMFITFLLMKRKVNEIINKLIMTLLNNIHISVLMYIHLSLMHRTVNEPFSSSPWDEINWAIFFVFFSKFYRNKYILNILKSNQIWIVITLF